MDPGRKPGGIIWLREIISEHPAEAAYDFRSRFGISSEELGTKISWREAVYLAAVLVRDPSSWIQASLAGWEYPVSREWIVASHTYDLVAAVNSKKKPKPYPNPFKEKNTQKVGKTTRTHEEVRKILAWMNPKET